ncbi:MAG: thiamine phosphate synthase, partial [Clostridia bacterium]|nr:thiamine phosphate synthase [Clostridia bacterium]
GTKPDADDVSFDTLKAICAAVSIPVVAIGGISQKNICKLVGSGIDGAGTRIGGGAHTATVTQGSPSVKLTPGAESYDNVPHVTFTFDGVKIYDPLNKINAGAGDLVYDAYNKIGQAGYSETVLRQALDANAAVIGDSALNSVFIAANAQAMSYAEMKAVCPTNEIWLAAGSSLSLRLNAQSALIFFACVDGTTSVSIDGQTYEVGYGTVYLPIPVNTAEVVTIQNTGGKLLSLRNLRYIPAPSQALFSPLTIREAEQHLVTLAKTQAQAEQTQAAGPILPRPDNGRRTLTLRALLEMIFGRFFEALRLAFIR